MHFALVRPRLLPCFSVLLRCVSQANKLKVMRSIVRNVFRPWGGRRSGSSSSRDVEADDLGGLLYPEADEVPETRYSKQLRRYKEWVRADDLARV